MTTARRAMSIAPSDPRVRRAYFDCRYGQLHMHHAIPGGGGFDEATPLLCIPGAPGLGGFFVPLLGALGRDRSVYAPDLPGCGQSDPAAGHVAGVDLGYALLDFLDSMHLRSVDLLAHEDGVAIALALIEMRAPQIVRVVLSPGTEAVRTAARSLQHPTLVVDALSGHVSGGALESQAAQLREFLGTAARRRVGARGDHA